MFATPTCQNRHAFNVTTDTNKKPLVENPLSKVGRFRLRKENARNCRQCYDRPVSMMLVCPVDTLLAHVVSVTAAQVHTLDAHWTVSGGSLTDTYQLLQFHFHWGSDSKTGSEHTMDSNQYPLEVRTVSSHAYIIM